jgi:group I intron endonuclease
MYGIIYSATNSISGKVYVGQTTMTLNQRIACHRINKRCRLFHRAIEKYGINAFEWATLDECSSKEDLDQKEMDWVEKLNATNHTFGYNLKSGGAGNGKHSEETKKLLSDIAKKSNRKPPINPMANLSVEQRMNESVKRNGTPFECHTKEGVFVGQYVSLGHAANDLGLQSCHIRNNLKGRKPTCCGYVFKYLRLGHQSLALK